MGSTRRKYTREYKAGAVELVINSGWSIAEVARNLDINEGTLGNWLNKAKKDGSVPIEQGVGTHIVADLIGARRLDDPHHVEAVLRDCAEAAGSSLLYIYVHCFDGGGGVSGVAVLAESHISVHSWPEYHFAAIDMFMCGAAEPSKALPVLQTGFEPERIVAHELVRGRGALRPGDTGRRPGQGRPTEDEVKTSAALTSLFLCENDPRWTMTFHDRLTRRGLMRHAYEDIWIGELWNVGDPAGGRVLAEDFFDNRPIEAFPNTKSGHIAMALDWHQAFPDYKFVIEDVIIEGDKLVARYNSSGTHLGVLSGIPATGRRVSLTGIDIMRFDGDLLAEWWHNEDMYDLMQQIMGSR